MLESSLLKLNFTPNEIKVYSALFEIGKCRAGKIIELTGMHRNLVYLALENLEARGLLTKVLVKGVAQFSANDPTALLDEIENKKEIARSAIEELAKKKGAENRDVQIFEGLEGVKRARNRVLNYPAGETFYVIGATKLNSEPELEAYWRKFHKARETKGINQKILFENSNDPILKDAISWRNKLPHMEARSLPFNIDSPFWIDFIKDNVNIGIAGHDPLTVSIKSPGIAEGFKKYFDYFWNQRVQVKSGLDAVREEIYNMLDELKPGEEYLVFGALGKDYPEGFTPLYDKFHTDRIKKGVVTKMLCYQESYQVLLDRFKRCGDEALKFSFVKKYISAPPIPMQINLYKGKAFFIIYDKTPTVIHFEQPQVNQAFLSYFENIWQQETYTLRGAEALQNIWLEAIDAKDLRFIGARGYFIDKFPKLFAVIEEKAKKTPGIRWRNIVDPGARGHRITNYPWAETKYSLPGVKNPNVVWLFGNKLVISNWAEGDTPVLFVSENKQLFQSYSDYFEALWNQRATTYDGVEQIKTLLLESVSFGDYDVFAEGKKITDVLGVDFFIKWQQEKKRLGVKSRGIMNSLYKDQPTVTKSITQMKFITGYAVPTVTLIFKEKVININFSDRPVAFLIEDAEIAESNRAYFNLLWKSGK